MSTARRSISEPGRGGGERLHAKGESKSSPPPAPIEVVNRQRQRAINRSAVARLARAALDRIGRPEATATFTFIRDPEMRRLNHEYRDLDAPTDVLAFAYHEGGGGPPGEPRHLGDVVISVDTAARDARQLGLTFDCEISRLVLHGVLHLAGYDHETDRGEMSRLERRLRRELWVSCP